MRQSRRVLHRLVVVLEEDIPAFLLAVIVVALVADVVGRYVFNSPLQYAAEVALIAFIWHVYLAVAAVARHGQHISIDVATGNLPPRVQAALQILVQLITLAVLGYLVVAGLTYFATGHFTSLTGTGLSKRFLELAIPVSAVLMVLYSVRDLAVAVRGVVTGRFTHKEHDLAEDTSWADDLSVPDNLTTGAIMQPAGEKELKK